MSVFSLAVNFSFLQTCKFQVIVKVMHNFEKNACSQDITIFWSLLRELLNSWLKAIEPKYITPSLYYPACTWRYMFNFQIYALRVEFSGFLNTKISSMRFVPSLPVNTARHVITFCTRQLVPLTTKRKSVSTGKAIQTLIILVSAR